MMVRSAAVKKGPRFSTCREEDALVGGLVTIDPGMMEALSVHRPRAPCVETGRILEPYIASPPGTRV